MSDHPRFQHVEGQEQKGIVRLTLARPEARNALNPELMTDVRDAVARFGADPATRAIVLQGAGRVFCAGADIRWFADHADAAPEIHHDHADLLLSLYRTIDECPCPVIGRVHGAARGGGVGLVAVCDIAVAAMGTEFAFSEVRLGMIPAVIAPFLLRRVSLAALRRYALTGEVFSAAAAQHIGLVDEVVADPALDGKIAEILGELQQAAPQAVRETKALLRQLTEVPAPERAGIGLKATVRMRGTPEAKEGLLAFLQKRPAAWSPRYRA